MRYKLKHDPIPFIMKHAGDIVKLSLLLKTGLLETKLAKDLLLNILKKQNPDGGFPNQFDKEASGLKTTYSTALLLIRCGMPAQCFSVQGALGFILKQQRPDGGFAEANDVPIPEWMTWESKEKSVTYYTARIIELLYLLGMDDTEVFKRAVSWLRGMQHSDGTYPVYEGSEIDPDTTVGVAFLMRELYGEQDEVYKRGKERFEEYLTELSEDAERGYHFYQGKREENDIYHLTHILHESVVAAGYDLHDPRVQKIVTAILMAQQPDGGWRVFWTKGSDPGYSVYTLELLLALKVISEDELQTRLLSSVK
ncbi:MAG: prenyltransferase/squalene oxidase repeat-containing protein [Thermoproteota archaeon]